MQGTSIQHFLFSEEAGAAIEDREYWAHLLACVTLLAECVGAIIYASATYSNARSDYNFVGFFYLLLLQVQQPVNCCDTTTSLRFAMPGGPCFQR